MKIVAGIDVSKRTLDVFIDGKPFQVANDATGFTRLRAECKRKRVDLVVMEATGSYHETIAIYLCEAGIDVVVLNPARSHYYAKCVGKRVKTDRVDAQVLARFGQTHEAELERYVPPRLSEREFRALVRMRHDLVRTCAAAKTRLQGPVLQALEAKLLHAQIAFFNEQIEVLDEQIKALIQADEALKRKEALLRSIPGVGAITAWTLLAEVGDFARFPSAKQLAAFAGVCPTFRHSGTSQNGPGRMSRAGNPTIRKLLYLAAMAALRSEGVFKTQYTHLVDQGKAKMTAVVAIMHKILRVAYGVIKTGQPFLNEKALTTYK